MLHIYDISRLRVNQAVCLFRVFFVRFDENVDANLSYWQNVKSTSRTGKNILLPEHINSNETARPTGEEYVYSITDACPSTSNKPRYVERIFVQSITGEFHRYIPLHSKYG